ncbi:MAG: tail fiber domain-containing protein, partial [Bacteroidota bacterium]
SDFQIRLDGQGTLQVVSANNADDEFGMTTTVAQFDLASLPYQFTVFGDALASGGTFTNSDRRLKQNIHQLENALAALLQLQPKRYEYDYKNEKYAYLNLPTEPQIGLLAQEVEQVFPELVKTNTLYKGGKEEDVAASDLLEEVDNLKAINYVALVPVLIAAVQEQQTQIEAKDDKIELLVQENEDIKARLAKIEVLLSEKVEINNTTSTLTSASLQQNAPNPFSEATTINYFIPEQVKSASLQILDQNGRIIKTIPIQDTGNGQLTLQANLLSAGTYSYSLILDGRVMETKQMVLTH